MHHTNLPYLCTCTNIDVILCQCTVLYFSSASSHIYLVSLLGKNRPQPNSLFRIVLAEFLNWRSQSPDPVPQCSPDDQAQAIDLLEKCHHIMFDNLVEVFNLRNADRKKLVTMIGCLKNDFRITDVTIILTC